MISLQEVQRDDAPLIMKWKEDDFVKRMALDHDYSTSIDEQSNDIQNALSDPDQDYKLIVLDDTRKIGYIRINWMDTARTKAWLRFALGEERGKGYSVPALKKYIALLKAGGCFRIEAEVYSGNVISQKILEKIGFLKEGVKRKAHFTGSDHTDVLVYGLLVDEFKVEPAP